VWSLSETRDTSKNYQNIIVMVSFDYDYYSTAGCRGSAVGSQQSQPATIDSDLASVLPGLILGLTKGRP
jgi:hypothetical protein